MSILTQKNLKKGLSLVDIAKELNNDKYYVVKNWRFEEEDGLDGELKMLNTEDLTDELDKLLKNENKYKNKTITFSDEYTEIGLYEGVKGAEELWKFFNVDKDRFDYLTDKDFFDDIFE